MNRDVCEHFNPIDLPCRECAAEPVVNQQLTTEPVAWVEPKWLDPDTRGWPSDSFASQPIEGWLPLFTAPTPRKPLTNEEILDMSDATDSGDYWHLRFARAIEKAHGIGEQDA